MLQPKSTVSSWPGRLPGFLAILLLGLVARPAFAQTTYGKWNEVVGKKIVNRQGVTLGYVRDSAVDLENGRYVGMIISYGGFLGLGQKTVIVPPGAVVDTGRPHALLLDMDEARFRNAPTFAMSKTVGPPYAAQVAQVYNYFGQSPYFTTDIQSSRPAGQKLEQLGYIQEGSRILLLPVENLQGKSLGDVVGLRDLSYTTGRLGGIVIMPDSFGAGFDKKIVQPQALRYNSKHDRLRLNDHEQSFGDSPDFQLTSGGSYLQQNPARPGNPLSPLVQGNSALDKRLTTQINDAILGDRSLSHYAKTVEIGTVKGRTIVRGRVQTSPDRAQILAYAKAAAGPGNVTDLLEVRETNASEQAIDTRPVTR